jgi:hypothetical protein
MKKQLLHFLLNPYFLSAIIAVGIIISLPNYFKKYQVELIDVNKIHRGSGLYFEDLDNDGYYERIQSQTNTLGNSSYLVFKSNGDQLDQFNYFKP